MVMMVVMVVGLLRVAVPLAVQPAVVPRLVVRLGLMWFPVLWADLHHWRLGRFLKQGGGVVQIVVVIVRTLVVPIVRVVLKPELLLLAGSGWSSLPT